MISSADTPRTRTITATAALSAPVWTVVLPPMVLMVLTV